MAELIEMTEKEQEYLWRDEENEHFILEDDSGGWDDQGKYQYAYPVYKRKSDGKFFQMSVCCSGSYHTDYDYSFMGALEEVVRKEVTIVEWVIA